MIRTTYPNGKIKTIQDDDGNLTAYYPSGLVRFRARCRCGHMDGDFVLYHPSGKLWRIETYKVGKLDGTRVIFDDDGNLTASESYADGLRHGTVCTYSPQGRCMSRARWRQGHLIYTEKAPWNEL